MKRQIKRVGGMIKGALIGCLKSRLVTVIVPIHNSEKTIGDCLDSLLAQSVIKPRIICVNDGSTDETMKILNAYRRKSRRIKIVNQKNGGRSVARNAGLRVLKTKYVMFCDSDDKYSNDMCEKMLRAIEGTKSDLAVCEIGVVYEAHEDMEESDRNYYGLKNEGKMEINDDVICNTDASVCNKIFRAKIIDKYNIRFPKGLNNEDYYFCNAYFSVSHTVFFLRRKLYNYIRRAGSIMSENFDGQKLSIDHLLVAEKLFDFYKKNGYLKEHENLFWKQWIESFWASFRFTSKRYHWQLKKEAEDFVEKNYKRYAPNDIEVINNMDGVIKTLDKIRKGKD